MTDPRRSLPSIEVVLQHLKASFTRLPHDLRADIARTAVHNARQAADTDQIPTELSVLANAAELATNRERSLLQPLINGTGILLHTNLGRAPLGESAVAAMVTNAQYSNLEFDVERGTRGSRHDHAGSLLARACGAEAGMAVNNNAAAVLLVLAAFARDREVIVSRGELVEIGGGFRVPEILAETGARLIEVGTTNRTRRNDYERAITAETAMLLKVHASNYRMIGFTQAAPIAELASLGIDVVVDAGSGLLDAHTPWLSERPAWLGDEPGIRQCLEDGAALVTFSGDKLLGGPQAGIIVGRRELIERCKQHPLARALRCDKVTLAALQAVAIAYLDRDVQAIPFWKMACTPLEALRLRAEAIISQVSGGTVVDTEAAAGGGSLPGLTIPSLGIGVRCDDARTALRMLRVDHHLVALARDGSVIVDLRSVDPTEDHRIVHALDALIKR